MILHKDLSDIALKRSIKRKEILFGGNKKLKIFGTLRCSSGRRMKKEHRIFFRSRSEATAHGFRPCGNCLKKYYDDWKNGFVQK